MDIGISTKLRLRHQVTSQLYRSFFTKFQNLTDTSVWNATSDITWDQVGNSIASIIHRFDI